MRVTQWDGTSACVVGAHNGDAVGCRSHLKETANVINIPLVMYAKLTTVGLWNTPCLARIRHQDPPLTATPKLA